jgi:hypothetical protein
MREKIEGVGVWVKHRVKSTVEPISPALIVLSIAAGVGAASAVIAVLAAREYHRK